MSDPSMDFECMNCRRLFSRRWYDLSRSFERLHFRSPSSLDEVEVDDAEGIGTFCSQRCLEEGRTPLMQEEGVPIPATRPGIGPVETCAKCSGLVDMSDWHLTYTEGCLEEERQGIRTLELAYVAVVCRMCAPVVQFDEAVVPVEDGERV